MEGAPNKKVKKVQVPGYGPLDLRHAVFDLNGTLTESGEFLPGVLDGLKALEQAGYKIYLLSGDTRGTLHETLQELPGIQAVATKTAGDKKKFVESIGP
jgi:soluble P-type ATPase